MDTTTTKETTKAPEREKTLSEEIRSLESHISYIEACVDGAYELYKGNRRFKDEVQQGGRTGRKV